MVRISKQSERRNQSPRKRQPKPSSAKKTQHKTKGFRAHANAVEGDLAAAMYIPKI